MRLENKELIEEFYKQINDQYPDLTFEQIREAAFIPWLFVKREMESGELPKIRLKYFGSFQVYKERARKMLYNLKDRFKFHKINAEQYFKYKQMIENYLNKIKQNEESS